MKWDKLELEILTIAERLDNVILGDSFGERRISETDIQLMRLYRRELLRIAGMDQNQKIEWSDVEEIQRLALNGRNVDCETLAAEILGMFGILKADEVKEPRKVPLERRRQDAERAKKLIDDYYLRE